MLGMRLADQLRLLNDQVVPVNFSSIIWTLRYQQRFKLTQLKAANTGVQSALPESPNSSPQNAKYFTCLLSKYWIQHCRAVSAERVGQRYHDAHKLTHGPY